ncbi:MAG: DUF4058 family protein [Chloroflexota bacterium]
MTSPFPGMDPYLEERLLWYDIHSSLIPYICEALHPQIHPAYVARQGERMEVSIVGQRTVSNVRTVEMPYGSLPRETAMDIPRIDEPPVIELFVEERQVPYLVIICRETGDVVTLIDVLSPANKIADGHEEYLQNQQERLQSQTNLVEIDLLSCGRPTTLARLYEIRKPADWRYMITVSRPRNRRQLQFYAIPLDQRLPRCRIPLREDEPDAVLDLPAIFTRCYEVGGYDHLIDYSRDPSVTLSEAEQAWMNTLLVDAGLR